MHNVGKVGIITLPGRFNYGNRLQNYAAERIFLNLGYKSESLVLRCGPSIAAAAKDVAKKMLGKQTVKPEDLMTKARLAAFDAFNKRINIREVAGDGKSLSSIKKEYDYFSVGSDQVWNPDYIKGLEDWYFLKFADGAQRVTLSPSIGLQQLDKRQKRMIEKGVRGLNSLSVREQRGAELIFESTGRTAQVTCDPTLAVSAQDWREVSCDALNPKKPYIFMYLLGGVNEEVTAVLADLEERGRYEVVMLTDRQREGELDAGPAEFIALIDNAAHVITDSFHGAVFASILESPLTIVHRSGGMSMFSRLQTLASMLGIEDKIYGNAGFSIDNASRYDGVSAAIDCQKANLFENLRNQINALQE